MGRSHATSGWCAGLLVAPLIGLNLSSSLLFAVVTAGYALLPDLDHPKAYASRLLGPVSGLLCRGLRSLSAMAYRATRGPQDEDSTGTHRHLSHTLPFAVSLGLLTAVGTWLSPLWGPVTVLAAGTLLAVAALGDWVLLTVVPAVGTWLAGTGSTEGTLHATAGWLGLAVGFGCLVHCLGDACTSCGCPILAPLKIHRQRWFRIHLPTIRVRIGRRIVTVPLGFSTGKRFEKRVVFPAFAVLGVLLFPGVWAVALDTLAAFG